MFDLFQWLGIGCTDLAIFLTVVGLGEGLWKCVSLLDFVRFVLCALWFRRWLLRRLLARSFGLLRFFAGFRVCLKTESDPQKWQTCRNTAPPHHIQPSGTQDKHTTGQLASIKVADHVFARRVPLAG